jgi:hypothetical protein
MKTQQNRRFTKQYVEPQESPRGLDCCDAAPCNVMCLQKTALFSPRGLAAAHSAQTCQKESCCIHATGRAGRRMWRIAAADGGRHVRLR